MGRRSTGTVEPRTSCIRLKFTHLRVRRQETLDLAPTPANLKAAQRLMGNIQAAITAGVYRREDYFQSAAPVAADTFKEYAAEWLKTLVAEKSTRRSYASNIRSTWTKAFGEKRMGQILFSDVKKAVAAKAKVASAKTVNNALIPLRDIFATAMKDGLIAKDPSDGIKNLKHQSPPPDPFDRDEMDLILGRLEHRAPEQIWNYYTMAFHAGLRPSENISFHWPDIDWKRRSVRVERALVEGEEKGTKTNTVRDVDLSDAALAALERQKAHTFMRDPQGPVFHNPKTDKPWTWPGPRPWMYFAPTLTALKIRGREPYQCRHTFATLLLMGGVNPAYIARQLGHANTGMLFKVYSKWIDGADKGREAAKARDVLGYNGGPKLDEEKVG
jgi:integrase